VWCDAGGFFIDPWRPVERAVVTHAHADHARWGSKHYLGSAAGETVLRARLGDDASIETIPWGERRRVGGAIVSLHPAGHILGSAQVRVEVGGEVWVVTGDYKVDPDPTCAAWEPVRCHTFVTESTFGLPVFRWPAAATVFGEIDGWWRENREAGRTSLLFGYALGKAQRLLAGVDPGIGPILVHGAVLKLVEAYRAAGVALPDVLPASVENAKKYRGEALVVAPPSAGGSTWVRKFQPASDAFASGWMAMRGTRRRRAGDRGFVLSDHVDWPQLLEAVSATEAERVWVTHGYTDIVARYLRDERGLDARVLPTRFSTDDEGEGEGGGPDERGDGVEESA
jgi:putative mRNA 3-end processing factor